VVRKISLMLWKFFTSSNRAAMGSVLCSPARMSRKPGRADSPRSPVFSNNFVEGAGLWNSHKTLPIAARIERKSYLALILVALINLSLLCEISHSETNTDQVCFPKGCVQVEVVQKQKELMRGLQFREFLSPNAGMLFIFSGLARHSFWMKDTKIPLDMIWMDYARRVVYIKKNVPPCHEDPCPVYTPHQEAMYVLEVNSGYADTLGLHIGDQAAYKIDLDR